MEGRSTWIAAALVAIGCSAPKFEVLGTADSGDAGTAGTSGGSGTAGTRGGPGTPGTRGSAGTAGSDASAGGTGGVLDAGGSDASFPDAGKDAGCSPVVQLTAVLGPTTVPVTAGTGSPWNNTGAVAKSDGADAWAGVSPASPLTEKLQVAGFGAKVPNNAIIVGIQVKIRRRTSKVTALRDTSVRLITSGGPKGANYAQLSNNWDNVYLTATYGAPTDKWGASWTAAEVNSSAFGVSLEATCPSPCGDNQARVDHIGVQLAYRTCP